VHLFLIEQKKLLDTKKIHFTTMRRSLCFWQAIMGNRQAGLLQLSITALTSITKEKPVFLVFLNALTTSQQQINCFRQQRMAGG
jgi:hypothetical protein